MPLGAGSNWPVAVDTDALLGPTSGIVAGVTHLGDTGTNQGDQLGITKNLINSVIKLENAVQCGQQWSVTNGAYTQPAIAATVAVTVNAAPQGTGWMKSGMVVYVDPGLAGGVVGGYYLVTLVTSSTAITLLNLAVQGINAAAAATVPTSSIIQFVGWSNIGETDQVALYEREWNNNQSVVISAANPDSDWTGTFTGSGAVGIDSTAGDATTLSNPGLWQVTSGATAASVANVAAKNIFIPSLTPLDITFSVSLTALSTTGTQEYTFGVGIGTSTAASVGNPFMGIGYKLNGGNTAWNVFAGATMGANITTTGVVVAINTLYHLRFTLNQGWTSLSAWVNHAGPTTVTTNLQTGTSFLQLVLSSTVGTTPKLVNWGRTKIRAYLPR